MKLRDATEQEYNDFLSIYPRPLVGDVIMFCEPPLIQKNDFSLGNWPDSVVASKSEKWGGGYTYRIAEQVIDATQQQAQDKGSFNPSGESMNDDIGGA